MCICRLIYHKNKKQFDEIKDVLVDIGFLALDNWLQGLEGQCKHLKKDMIEDVIKLKVKPKIPKEH